VTAPRLEAFVAPRNELEEEFEHFVTDCSAPRTEVLGEHALGTTRVGSMAADNEGIGDEGS
jgi:hypothetical protein